MNLSNPSTFNLQPSTLLIELPTWLGDTIMATPAIENIIKTVNPKKITIVGSYVSTNALKNHPKIDKIFIDNTKKSKNRLFATYKLAKKIGKHDIAISFRSHFFSKLLLFFTGSKKRYIFTPSLLHSFTANLHQVEKYNYFINSIFKTNLPPSDLKLYLPSIKNSLLPSALNLQPLLGINPGATYGSAKRWYSKYFAQVAKHFSNNFKIVIFGGPNEVSIAKEIENFLLQEGVEPINLAGKTSIEELIFYISKLSLFITNDSGPMHIAAAFKIPTVAIFGPTDYSSTSQWKNPKGKVVSLNLECAPCMKRVCPLKHHKCMKDLTPNMVIKTAKELI
ncbi:lipopolysaccharide heptosyltransferase II [Nitrosophilus kaiyonis]|uniref:lipopolysaccharide heptosyltransferase II n=1 Tax=Nitrosophilus kaiyonis TaxID=2930200 RepID=UPI0024930B9D|nr:lipopolysaccharide heptosyltransferase II [Nitrosophilus kaiyonis]